MKITSQRPDGLVLLMSLTAYGPRRETAWGHLPLHLAHHLLHIVPFHAFHHLLHLFELFKEAVHAWYVGAGSFGDALLTARPDDVGVAAFFEGHRFDRCLHLDHHLVIHGLLHRLWVGTHAPRHFAHQAGEAAHFFHLLEL